MVLDAIEGRWAYDWLEGYVLLSVTGASGVGKSTTLEALRRALAGWPVTCVEFDSVGVPPDADRPWRHGVVEHWVRHAAVEQQAGRHLVVCGQVPVGELLAAPSAVELDGIASLLLHCSPHVRRTRLLGRGEAPERMSDHLAFGEWFLRHTLDPAYMPHVVQIDSPVQMCWERWADWTAEDARWSFEVIDTNALTPEEVADQVTAWAQDVLAGRRSVLRPGWVTR